MSVDPFWYNNYDIIFSDQRYLEFFPTKQMNMTEKLNAITRFAIYVSIALSVLTHNYNYFVILIFVMAMTYFLYTNESAKEHFLPPTKNVKNCTMPEKDNPFMNINLITDDKTKPEACISHNDVDVKNNIEGKFNDKLYRDVGDMYGKNNSQREYYTMPSTTIPNKQTSYAKWLYKQSSTCKEDGVKCAPNWDVE
jgi:hypothetical protein